MRAVGVRELGVVVGHGPRSAVLLDGLGEPRFLAVVSVAGSDRSRGSGRFPIACSRSTIERWIELAVLPLEAAIAPGRAQQCRGRVPPSGAAGPEVIRSPFSRWCRGSRRSRFRWRRASRRRVCRCRELSCVEVAVDAVHAFFEMNVLQVDGLLRICRDRRRRRPCRPRRADCLCGRACRRRGKSSRGRGSRRTGCSSSLALNSGLPILSRNFTSLHSAAQPRRFRIAHAGFAAALRGWDCAALPDTSCRRPFRCPTRCSRNRWSPCSCRDGCGRPCTGSTGWRA